MTPVDNDNALACAQDRFVKPITSMHRDQQNREACQSLLLSILKKNDERINRKMVSSTVYSHWISK